MINDEPILAKDELARRTGEVLLLDGGEYELTSGKESSFYYDIKGLGEHPELQKSFSCHASKVIEDEGLNPDVLAGEGKGGAATVPSLAAHTGNKWALLRDEEKDYGTENEVEGAEVEGRNVLYVDDVVTSGGSAVEGIQRIEENGANVVGFLTYVDRQEEHGMANIESETGVETYSVLEDEEVAEQLETI